MTIARRLAGIALGVLPFALVLHSMATATLPASFSWTALGLATLALVFALFNIWLAFGRPLYLSWRHPQFEHRHVSGIPVVGNVIAVMAVIVGSGTLGTSLLALLAILVDIGGLPWFVIFTWRDQTLWEPR
jgi:hypothetical protein